MRKTVRRWTGRGLTYAAAVATTLALAPLGTAEAATPGTLTLCSRGDFGSYAVFPNRGGVATTIVPAGKCNSIRFGGNGPEPVEIRMASGNRYIGPVTYDGRAGLNVATVNGPGFYVF